jgi:hypothetical protein
LRSKSQMIYNLERKEYVFSVSVLALHYIPKYDHLWFKLATFLGFVN